MAQIQRIHADPAQTTASAHHDRETKSHRESHELRIRTGLPQMIRRNQLKLLIPLADSTIYEMEQRGEFPRRFSLTSRCVVWDLTEVEAWIEQRKMDFYAGRVRLAPAPDVHMRRARPTSRTTVPKNDNL